MTYIMIKEEGNVQDDSTDKGTSDGHVSILVSVDRLVVHRQVDCNVSVMETI